MAYSCHLYFYSIYTAPAPGYCTKRTPAGARITTYTNAQMRFSQVFRYTPISRLFFWDLLRLPLLVNYVVGTNNEIETRNIEWSGTIPSTVMVDTTHRTTTRCESNDSIKSAFEELRRLHQQCLGLVDAIAWMLEKETRRNRSTKIL